MFSSDSNYFDLFFAHINFIHNIPCKISQCHFDRSDKDFLSVADEGFTDEMGVSVM